MKPNRNLISRFGHSAVTTSLLAGLDTSGYRYRYNPLLSTQLTPQIGVLAGPSTLASVLDLVAPRELAVMAGPNLTIAPSEIGHLYSDHRVKLVLVPSEGVARAYSEDLPEIDKKLRVWPAGVDTDYWSPGAPNSESQLVTLFIKQDWSKVAEELQKALRQSRVSVNVIRYGYYQRSHYRASLQRSNALIYLGSTESQCIAQFEAWACNVPTFVHALPSANEGLPLLPKIRGVHNLSAAPFLSSDTGAMWTSVEECLHHVRNASTFGASPRRWVMTNASLAVAAKAYLAHSDELLVC